MEGGGADMIYLCYVLFGLGILSYIYSAFNASSGTGETFSDVANALMLITIALLMFRAAHREKKKSDL
jgi:hypothetical protein